ncbi:hypothetical protein GE21DRAFT_1234 [Neurospora crassa]|uniref:Uncharacterized protein n=2 Tax=Neurospora crassa TaxID=5141 RepID=Q7SEU9_NEUCR|nr:hypothetical protein NCU03183 [Neurospora crassa OR74A]EAA35353.1 hypothetical protein NCU03183 [Neurospora crassa OR74A]KHE86039.1 hypothetical protein GE21DRAFT_1234 [Neurospora crassa]CAE76526.1 hypothetical protein [Neurospora crassa]|eukprot:XP_964589.1 hypothetical protein NCU03183 [Neurospora crassa OR74A]
MGYVHKEVSTLIFVTGYNRTEHTSRHCCKIKRAVMMAFCGRWNGYGTMAHSGVITDRVQPVPCPKRYPAAAITDFLIPCGTRSRRRFDEEEKGHLKLACRVMPAWHSWSQNP